MLSKTKGLSFYDEAGEAVLPEPRGDVDMGAWFGSAELKAATVKKMTKHRKQDQITQGLYQAGLLVGDTSTYGKFEFKGCLVGCTLPPMNLAWYDEMVSSHGGGWHTLVTRFYNITEGLAHLLDNWFEDQWENEAPDFAVNALQAIPVGAVYSAAQYEAMGDLDSDDVEAFLEILANPAFIRTAVAA